MLNDKFGLVVKFLGHFLMVRWVWELTVDEKPQKRKNWIVMNQLYPHYAVFLSTNVLCLVYNLIYHVRNMVHELYTPKIAKLDQLGPQYH